jgi:hypothetical protein
MWRSLEGGLEPPGTVSRCYAMLESIYIDSNIVSKSDIARFLVFCRFTKRFFSSFLKIFHLDKRLPKTKNQRAYIPKKLIPIFA